MEWDLGVWFFHEDEMRVAVVKACESRINYASFHFKSGTYNALSATLGFDCKRYKELK